MDFEQLKPLLHQQSDTLYIVNFKQPGAPVLRRYPTSSRLTEIQGREGEGADGELGFSQTARGRLVPFIHKHDMRNEVILLDDPRQNDWIPQVDEDWTGALPATLIYGQNFRYFYHLS